MLSKLKINNFVLIEELEVSFVSGFNVIIGETGAGKSILINALLVLLGKKSSIDYIRSSSDRAIIEGSFVFPNINLVKLFSELDIIIESDELIIRREISLKGNSRCFINDSPVTLSVLKYFCSKLFSLHSQNEESKVLEEKEQLNIIDSLLTNKSILLDYKKTYNVYRELENEYNLLHSKQNNSIEQREILARLYNEIDEINPKLGEDIEILQSLKVLESAEHISLIIDNIKSLLDNEDSYISTIKTLNEALKSLTKLTEIDNTFEQYKFEFNNAVISINETYSFVNKYKDNIEFNTQQIELLRNRFAELRKLIKKYGSINETLAKKDEYANELSLITNFNHNITELKSKITASKDKLLQIAEILTNERIKTANLLSKQLVSELYKLGIENANIRFDFTLTDFNDKGRDSIAFLISTNKGESPAPIEEIASGGEISRIMLALKTILASKDNTPIIIFDEIDVGISGRIAQSVGKSIKNLSKYHQIIAITHLPQVAAKGDNIISVEKQEIGKKTITNARNLNANDKLNEIAKMLSGDKLTDIAIENAKELCGIE